MNIELEREKLILFTKIGAIVLTSIALLATSLLVYPDSAETIGESLIHAKELPIYCVERDKPQISISFDAAWGNLDTSKLLETLKKHNVKATFFMTGGWIEKYPDDVKAIAAAGHDLGNHSENHKHMSELSLEQCKEEIMTPHEKVKKVTEHKHLGNGSIILCHNGGKHTAEALDELLATLKQKGFELVPISQLIYRDNFEMDTEGRQHPAGNTSTPAVSVSDSPSTT